MKAKVIIAGHNDIAREKIRRSLEPSGIETIEALDSAEIVRKAKTLNPDVILINSAMSIEETKDAARALKNDRETRSIPLIIISGEDDDENWDEAFEVIQDTEGFSKIREDVTRLIAQRHSIVSDIVMAQEGFLDEDFERFQEFLISKIGLFFDQKRKLDLMRALKRRMLAVGIVDNFSAYFSFLTKSPHESRELKNLILHITVGETTFFRSPDQFKAFSEYILPKLVKRKREIAARSGMPLNINIWSTACSTGEEPYSIIIALMEGLEDFDDWQINVKATDINTRFLKAANKAVYPSRKVRFVPEYMLKKYFTYEGGQYRVIDRVRDMVKFDFHNLSSDDFSATMRLDMIFCRNVLIYFKRDRIKDVINRLRDSLVDKGFLMLGYSETLFQISNDFKSIHYGDAFFYQKDLKFQQIRTRPEAEIAKPMQAAMAQTGLAPFKTLDMELPKVGNITPAEPHDFPTILPPELPEPTSIEEPGFTKEDFPEEAIEAKASEMELWEKGLSEYFEERFEDAEETFNKIREVSQGSERAELGQAFIMANRGADDEAIERCQKALEINEFLPEAYYLMGLISEKKGREEIALKQYQKVLLLDQDFAMAHFNLAILYMKKGRTKDARREFSNSLDILERWDENPSVKFSGGLHRDALIQLCKDMQE